MSLTALDFDDAVTAQRYSFVPRRLIIAGFTGREQSEVDKHVEELRAFGAVVPESTPAFFDLDPGLLTTSDAIRVRGSFTSGEVEPVVVVADDTLLLTVGSDHTDRELERESLHKSKAACPKIVSTRCIRIDAIYDWDAIELTSWVDDEPAPYQRGLLRALLPLDDLTERLAGRGTALEDGDVLFMGTVPVTGGGLRPSGRFRGTLSVPDLDRELTVDYRTIDDRTGRQ
jgi:hypothetical protein